MCSLRAHGLLASEILESRRLLGLEARRALRKIPAVGELYGMDLAHEIQNDIGVIITDTIQGVIGRLGRRPFLQP